MKTILVALVALGVSIFSAFQGIKWIEDMTRRFVAIECVATGKFVVRSVTDLCQRENNEQQTVR